MATQVFNLKKGAHGLQGPYRIYPNLEMALKVLLGGKKFPYLIFPTKIETVNMVKIPGIAATVLFSTLQKGKGKS